MIKILLIILVILIIWYSISSIITWIVYKIDPVDQIIGWKTNKVSGVYYVYKRFPIQPKPIFWLGAHDWQCEAVAKLMCKHKSTFDFDRYSVHDYLLIMPIGSTNIWPNENIRDLLDPEGWCPEDVNK